MSHNSRNGKTGVKGTHFQNPVLVGGGPLDDIPRGAADLADSAYKIYYEDFGEQFADGQLATMGWTVTDTGGGSPQAHDPNRLFTKCICLVFAGDNDAGTAVGVGTAVANPQRTGHRTGHSIFRVRKHVKRDRLSINSLVI